MKISEELVRMSRWLKDEADKTKRLEGILVDAVSLIQRVRYESEGEFDAFNGARIRAMEPELKRFVEDAEVFLK